jgi:hypothetical protein
LFGLDLLKDILNEGEKKFASKLEQLVELLRYHKTLIEEINKKKIFVNDPEEVKLLDQAAFELNTVIFESRDELEQTIILPRNLFDA